MAEGKWVRGLKPETPPLDAARRVLEGRLAVVVEYLPKAVHPPRRDPEFVHQLRVGTRRTDAAFRIFRGCLPGRVYREARSRLRKIRRAAGAARDWDVFLAALEVRAAEAKPNELPGLDCLIGMALGQRREAQRALEAVEPVLAFAEFSHAIIGSLRQPEDDARQLGDLATKVIHHRLEALDQAATGDLDEFAHLHQVRIAGKRLRYGMEVLGECLPPIFHDTLYPMVEEMQEILGRANDSHVAGERLTALREQLKAMPAVRARVKPGVESLLRFHQRRQSQERKRFLNWWPGWVEAANLAVEQLPRSQP